MQLNNAVVIENADVAGAYLTQWQNLVDSESDFTKDLVAKNAQSPHHFGDTDVWFTRVRNKSKKNEGLGVDLEALVDLVNSAKKMILYVMFQPGPKPLQSILALGSKLYVRGVVNTLSSTTQENSPSSTPSRGSFTPISFSLMASAAASLPGSARSPAISSSIRIKTLVSKP